MTDLDRRDKGLHISRRWCDSRVRYECSIAPEGCICNKAEPERAVLEGKR